MDRPTWHFDSHTHPRNTRGIGRRKRRNQSYPTGTASNGERGRSSLGCVLMLTCGDTFITSDDESDEWHLQILVTSPNDAGEVITVSVTTQRNKSETLVILPADCHPFIDRPSVI